MHELWRSQTFKSALDGEELNICPVRISSDFPHRGLLSGFYHNTCLLLLTWRVCESWTRSGSWNDGSMFSRSLQVDTEDAGDWKGMEDELLTASPQRRQQMHQAIEGNRRPWFWKHWSNLRGVFDRFWALGVTFLLVQTDVCAVHCLLLSYRACTCDG